MIISKISLYSSTRLVYNKISSYSLQLANIPKVALPWTRASAHHSPDHHEENYSIGETWQELFHNLAADAQP